VTISFSSNILHHGVSKTVSGNSKEEPQRRRHNKLHLEDGDLNSK
jgi:hypothetical protein